MKKLFKILILFILALIVVLCCSCEKQDKGAISVVCTGFAEYDWAKNVIGEGNDAITLIYLLEDGSDAHSFQPSISDIAKVSECDLFIYSGGSSYSWCEEIVKSANNKSMATLCIYSLFEDELISSSNSSCEDHEHDHSDHIHAGYDEHLWLSLVNAQKAVKAICEALCQVDTENTARYLSNAENYTQKLSTLHEQYITAVSEAENKTLIFADRFPFGYLARDYSIDFYSAYTGCTADSELSQDRIIFLADKMDELSLSYVCIIETSEERLANTIISVTQNKNALVTRFNSCQSVTMLEIQNGANYLEIMEQNLEALKTSLG
ncbi:MAG: zinc ABC transporter substrate-binding protein [Clostridia bacterium]|nr:zinc ABC transporter substrate-binding protein [Clostridia bacterium]